MEYRIDELAQAAGVRVRNIRAYQERGLLPPPRLEGRVGYYSDAHLARLRLIGHLLEQGYTLTLVGRLIEHWQAGRDLADVLGLEEALGAPWSDEPAAPVSRDQLVDMLGEPVLAVLPRLIELGVLEQRDDELLQAPSLRLLDAGAQLVATGVPLVAVLELTEQLVADTDRIARRLVAVVSRHLLAGLDDPPDADQLRELASIVRRLRPLAGVAVQAQLATALQRAVRDEFGEVLAAVRPERE